MAGRCPDSGRRDQGSYSEQQRKGDQVENCRGLAMDACDPGELAVG